MILYVSIANLLFLFRYTLMGLGRQRRKIYPIVLWVLFVFSAFRFEVGCDWSGYLNQWNVQQHSTYQAALSGSDPAWWIIIQGLQDLGLSYPWLNVASSVIFFTGIHVLARRQPDPMGFLILLFPILIINMPMSGIRQAAAIGLMCIAFVAFVDKRVFRFAAWTLVASAFHASAIVFLLLVPLVGGAYSIKRLFFAALCSVPGLLILSTGEAVDVAASRYVDTDIDAAGAVFRVGLLLATGAAYFLVFQKKWKLSFPRDYTLASVGALIMCAMILLVPLSSVIADRLGYYLIPIQAMIFARIPYIQNGRSRSLCSAAPYVGLGLVLIVWTSQSAIFTQCYVPYNSWVLGVPASSDYIY
jgi:hypothetical protein